MRNLRTLAVGKLDRFVHKGPVLMEGNTTPKSALRRHSLYHLFGWQATDDGRTTFKREDWLLNACASVSTHSVWCRCGSICSIQPRMRLQYRAGAVPSYRQHVMALL